LLKRIVSFVVMVIGRTGVDYNFLLMMKQIRSMILAGANEIGGS